MHFCPLYHAKSRHVQLVSVLRLSEEQLPEAERLHCLKLFSNLLSTQVCSSETGSCRTPASLQEPCCGMRNPCNSGGNNGIHLYDPCRK